MTSVLLLSGCRSPPSYNVGFKLGWKYDTGMCSGARVKATRPQKSDDNELEKTTSEIGTLNNVFVTM